MTHQFAPPAPDVVVNFAHNVWNIVAVAIGRFVQSRTGIVVEFHDPRFRIGRPRQEHRVRVAGHNTNFEPSR